jgi:hypothetical protein
VIKNLDISEALPLLVNIQVNRVYYIKVLINYNYLSYIINKIITKTLDLPFINIESFISRESLFKSYKEGTLAKEDH